MFSTSKPTEIGSADSLNNKNSVPSIISQDLVIRGNLLSTGEIQIDGTVHGDIETATLLVGENAEINGEIEAKRVGIHGRVNGQVTAQSVTLAKTAHMIGDVVYEDLSIEKGAYLKGYCNPLEAIAEQTQNPAASVQGSGDKAQAVPQEPFQTEGATPIKKLEKPGNGSGKSAVA